MVPRRLARRPAPKVGSEFARLNWASGDRLWSLEINEKAQPVTPERDKGDPFATPSFSLTPRQLSIVRLRQLEGEHSILFERPLSFPAVELLVANDGNTIVALDQKEVEVFTAPDWKSAANWKLPKPSRKLHDRREYQISPDGRSLAVAESHRFPSLLDVKTGKPQALGSSHSGLINSLEFSVNGAELTSMDENRTICRWNAESGKLLDVASSSPALPRSSVKIASIASRSWPRMENFGPSLARTAACTVVLRRSRFASALKRANRRKTKTSKRTPEGR